MKSLNISAFTFTPVWIKMVCTVCAFVSIRLSLYTLCDVVQVQLIIVKFGLHAPNAPMDISAPHLVFVCLYLYASLWWAVWVLKILTGHQFLTIGFRFVKVRIQLVIIEGRLRGPTKTEHVLNHFMCLGVCTLSVLLRLISEVQNTPVCNLWVFEALC